MINSTKENAKQRNVIVDLSIYWVHRFINKEFSFEINKNIFTENEDEDYKFIDFKNIKEFNPIRDIPLEAMDHLCSPIMHRISRRKDIFETIIPEYYPNDSVNPKIRILDILNRVRFGVNLKKDITSGQKLNLFKDVIIDKRLNINKEKYKNIYKQIIKDIVSDSKWALEEVCSGSA
jgi:hypothetical protein